MRDLQEGVVFSFNERGYGFIANGDRSIFFHARHVQDGYILHRGDRVTFFIAESVVHPGKLECINITLVERAAKAVQA